MKMPRVLRILLLLLPGLLALGWYVTRPMADIELEDPHLYSELAARTLGRPYNANYVYWKRTQQQDLAQHPYRAVPPGPQCPYRDFAVEYPPLALGFFILPRLITDDLAAYLRIFQGLMALTVLATGYLLARILNSSRPAAAPHAEIAAALTSAFIILVGTPLLNRFDPLVALALAGATAAALSRKPGLAGVCLGAAAALKLWPIILLPVFLLRLHYQRDHRAALRTTLGFLALPVLSHAVLLPAAGMQVLSYLSFHSGRGVQLESTWSSLMLLLAKTFDLAAETVFDHGSANLDMPALSPFIPRVAAVLAVLALAAVYLAAARALRRAPDSPRPFLTSLLALAAALIVTATVLSPQYLVWLFPLALAVPCWRTMALYLLALALTRLYFPNLLLGYDSLMEHTWPAVVLLLARNLTLVLLALQAFRLTLRPLSPPWHNAHIAPCPHRCIHL